mmetsp:Transcript_5868/g.11858  ORF Transcript_5868/g.11858 Transcript_5868/m.11858 type:complete len:795 (+) Transcript_5868:84-2468(+)
MAVEASVIAQCAADVATDGDAAELTAQRVVGARPLRSQAWQDCAQQVVSALRQRGGGELLRGWRRELDPDGLLEVHFKQFCQAAGRLGITGDVSVLFSLERDHQGLTLAELAPEEGLTMGRFKRWVKGKFGGPEKMFQVFDETGLGRLHEDPFMAACRKHGFDASDGDIRDIFACCDVEGAKSLCDVDVLFLEADQQIRDVKRFKRRMDQKDQQQQLFMSAYEESCAKPPRHRLAPRPWQAETFESHLPAVVSQKRQGWQRQVQRRGEEAHASFMRQLRSAYGNEVRAWRLGLDPETTFELSLQSVRRYCSRTHLRVDVQVLWKSMDLDSSGTLELEEFCPKPAEALASFQRWAKEAAGSCAALWDQPEAEQARLLPQRGGSWRSDKKMLLETFEEVLRTLGWTEASGSCQPSGHDIAATNAKALVLASLDLYGCGFISRSDLEWLDKWDAPQWLSAKPDRRAWEELRALILAKYRHPLRAWRSLLDKDDSNQISWTEFRHACKQLRFKGNVAGAWREVDADRSGLVSLAEFDAPSAELLGSFKEWIETNFGSIEQAFKALDSDGSGCISYSELKCVCRRLKWGGSVRTLFDCLDAGGQRDTDGRATLSFDEVSFLDSWQAEPGAALQRARTFSTFPSPADAEAEGREDSTQAPAVLRRSSLRLGSKGTFSAASLPPVGEDAIRRTRTAPSSLLAAAMLQTQRLNSQGSGGEEASVAYPSADGEEELPGRCAALYDKEEPCLQHPKAAGGSTDWISARQRLMLCSLPRTAGARRGQGRRRASYSHLRSSALAGA